MHVLLADDDTSTRELVVRALEGAGHSVVACDGGGEAETALAACENAFDLIVTDVEMPGLDGIELADRAIASHPQIRVLFISGFADKLDGAHAKMSQRAGKLLKPFTLNDLREAVDALSK